MLSDILHMELAKPQAITLDGRNPHVFEIHVGETIYFVGEDPTCGGKKDNVMTSTESGTGIQQALCWENAIHQALMPVTPQPSAEPDKSQFISDPV